MNYGAICQLSVAAYRYHSDERDVLEPPVKGSLSDLLP